MQVLNVHQRHLAAPAARVGALIDSLASRDDRLWPIGAWPRMVLDRPLAVGAAGGHGPIGYVVDSYEPQHRVVFRFTAPSGFTGTHWLEAIPLGDDRTLLRHSLQMTATGWARLSWPLAFGPLHDALIEDALSRAERAVGQHATVKPWSPWVRILRYVLSGGRARAQTIGAHANNHGSNEPVR